MCVNTRWFSRNAPTRFPYTPGCFSKNGSVLAHTGGHGVALCRLGDTTGQVPIIRSHLQESEPRYPVSAFALRGACCWAVVQCKPEL